jgi:hypothetical protein
VTEETSLKSIITRIDLNRALARSSEARQISRRNGQSKMDINEQELPWVTLSGAQKRTKPIARSAFARYFFIPWVAD